MINQFKINIFRFAIKIRNMGFMIEAESPKYRFMVETPNQLKIHCLNEEDLSKIIEKYGLFVKNPVSTGTGKLKSHTLSSTLKQILDNNPLTLNDLRLEISKNTEFSNIRTRYIQCNWAI
jgi:hypothetical protein